MSYTQAQIGKFIGQLTSALFKHEYARTAKILQGIVEKNRELSGIGYGGFYLDGELHIDKIPGMTVRQSSTFKHALDPSLISQAMAYAQDNGTLKLDKTRIKHALGLSLRGCLLPEDMRDALPDALSEMVPSFKPLPRTRPEAFTLEGKTQQLEQYWKLREKIDFYVASRLLY